MAYTPSSEIGMTPEDTKAFEALLLPEERAEFLHTKFASIAASLATEARLNDKRFVNGFPPPVFARVGRELRKR